MTLANCVFLVQESTKYRPDFDQRGASFHFRPVHKSEGERCNLEQDDTDWQQFTGESKLAAETFFPPET